MPDTQITHTIGRRKEAVCRVYLKPGSGKWDINGRTLGDYFPRPALVTAIQQPFTATDRLGQYDVKANVNGGGQSGQAGALRLAVARALVKIDEAHRTKLRNLGLLHRVIDLLYRLSISKIDDPKNHQRNPGGKYVTVADDLVDHSRRSRADEVRR